MSDTVGFGTCPTVRIASEDSPDGFCIINKEDFNEDTMELFADEVPGPSDPPVNYEDMTKDELAAELNERDIDFSLSSKKDELIELLTEDDEE